MWKWAAVLQRIPIYDGIIQKSLRQQRYATSQKGRTKHNKSATLCYYSQLKKYSPNHPIPMCCWSILLQNLLISHPNCNKNKPISSLSIAANRYIDIIYVSNGQRNLNESHRSFNCIYDGVWLSFHHKNKV